MKTWLKAPPEKVPRGEFQANRGRQWSDDRSAGVGGVELQFASERIDQ